MTNIENRIEVLENTVNQLKKDLAGLKAESQYCNLKVLAVGTSVTFKGVHLEDGKTTSDFSPTIIPSGKSGSGSWFGKSYSLYGTTGKVSFTIDENNTFNYKFSSPYSGTNISKFVDENYDKEKYKVIFIEQGNITDQGALGGVVIQVKKLREE